MTVTDRLFSWLTLAAVASPAVLVAVVGLPLLVSVPIKERFVASVTHLAVVIGLLCSVGVLALMLATGRVEAPSAEYPWVVLSADHFHINFGFVFDRLSAPFAILSYVLVGTISAFASRYLHREPGFNRFFLLNALFLLGMVVASTAETIETLFVGWELVGLSSALLVGFFHERLAPVMNGQRVWSMYRVADAAFLIAAVAMHRMQSEGKFAWLIDKDHTWPEGLSTLEPRQALIVGLLLLVAVAGKSALIPFSGWLPRAMEGPTPSSAVFYGALSVHLGAFLLLRTSPIFEASPLLSGVVIALGALTAVYAIFTGRVQADVKTVLAYASLMQVGIIVAEIGLTTLIAGMWGATFRFAPLLLYIPLVHIMGHACLRTLQFVRAPNLLADYHSLENYIGSQLPNQASRFDAWIPGRMKVWLYRLSFERGYLDALINEYIVRPFLAFFRLCDGCERAWLRFLSRPDRSRADEPAAAEERT
jgi:NAD(P)H-quinone oxidoreductase subunit 5